MAENPKNLVELVELSGIYEFNRGQKLREVAKIADEVAWTLLTTTNPLSDSLEDIGITENAVHPYYSLARRIDTICLNAMDENKQYPIVQVSSLLDAIAETTETLFSGAEPIHKEVKQ